MSLFQKTDEERVAIAEMKAADQALHENSEREQKAGIDYETPDYHRLNDAANEEAAKVSFWHGGPRKGR